MSWADRWGWSEILVPFSEVLGPLGPAELILGAVDARQGQYQGERVWLVWKVDRQANGSTMSIAMRAGGYPIDGGIMVDNKQLDLASASDAAFAEVAHVRVTPPEVAALALSDARARANVQKVLRDRRVGAIRLTQGFLWTNAEFSAGFMGSSRRPPSREEVTSLVEGVAGLAERFRTAYEACYAEIAQSQGEAAARAWQMQSQRVATHNEGRGRRIELIMLGCALFAVCALLMGALGFAWLLSG